MTYLYTWLSPCLSYPDYLFGKECFQHTGAAMFDGTLLAVFIIFLWTNREQFVWDWCKFMYCAAGSEVILVVGSTSFIRLLSTYYAFESCGWTTWMSTFMSFLCAGFSITQTYPFEPVHFNSSLQSPVLCPLKDYYVDSTVQMPSASYAGSQSLWTQVTISLIAIIFSWTFLIQEKWEIYYLPLFAFVFRVSKSDLFSDLYFLERKIVWYCRSIILQAIQSSEDLEISSGTNFLYFII